MNKYQLLFVLIFYFKFSFCQLENRCFVNANPLDYGVSKVISFSDSSFTIDYTAGLLKETLKGKYNLKGNAIILTVQWNSYDSVLTNYPIIFAVIRKNKLYFLEENLKPEKGYYTIQTRKGITTSKKKRRIPYIKCN